MYTLKTDDPKKTDWGFYKREQTNNGLIVIACMIGLFVLCKAL